MGKCEAGRLSFDKAIQLDNNGVVAYVLMADIFGSVGMLEDEKEKEIENMIKIKYDTWRMQKYEHAMDVYANEHIMDAYIDHG